MHCCGCCNGPTGLFLGQQICNTQLCCLHEGKLAKGGAASPLILQPVGRKLLSPSGPNLYCGRIDSASSADSPCLDSSSGSTLSLSPSRGTVSSVAFMPKLHKPWANLGHDSTHSHTVKANAFYYKQPFSTRYHGQHSVLQPAGLLAGAGSCRGS